MSAWKNEDKAAFKMHFSLNVTKKIPTFSDAKTPSFPQCHRVSLVNYLVQCLNLFSSLSGGFGILESTPDTILLRELKFGPVIEPK